MHTTNISYYQNQVEHVGYLASKDKTKKPGVIVAHDWSGRNEFACKTAERLAELGYVGFAMDVFGELKIGHTNEEKSNLIQPFMQDRTLLLAKMMAAYETLKQQPEVDSNRIAAIGFCFGGLCVLDLARSGTAFNGVVSFHGLLNPPEAHAEMIKAKVLVLHGYEDPMVKPEQVNAFCEEMTKAKADWQVDMYGHTKHAFTNPLAHDNELGLVYDAHIAARAWKSMENFLEEIFKS